ncbi:MAG TPA: FAD-dependent oxidoreductase [Gemmatimonadaceae bacterium]|nr:FAD-dependent oxidoreductase [Gemmatimonadaceae bacterium]
MPRTPLFGLVQRSLRLAQLAAVRGEPLDEIADRALSASRRPNDITRRRFLAVTAAASAAIALDGCMPRRRAGNPLPEPRDDVEPVLIIGAGIAGLTAAYRLRQHGVPVRVVEAQQRVGGRMYSLRDTFADGQLCELGGELIDTGHSSIRALAAELGIELDDLRQVDAGYDPDVWWVGGARRSTTEVVAALAPVAAQLDADRASWPEDFDPTYRNPLGAQSLDRMTIASWLDGMGASGWIRELLDVAFTTEYGMPLDEQSALNMLTMLSVRPDGLEMYGESDERFHVHEGNDTIPLTLARYMGDSIEMGTVLEAVSQRGDGKFICSLRRGSSSADATASHLLVAIPFTTLRNVRLDLPLPEVKRRAIEELGYGKNAKLMVGFSDRVWRTRYRSNGSVMTSLPFQTTWETSRGQSGSAGILTNFTGGAHALELGRGTAEEQGQTMVADLDRVFRGARAAHVGMKSVRFHWPSFPWTLGSYAGYLPGQWTSIRGAEGESVGRLYFAGEHCSLPAQGFMEGGCETGEAAAKAILTSLRVAAAPGMGRGEPRRLATGTAGAGL